MQTGFIEHNNGKLYFELQGEGELLVFIHGFSLDHRMWRPQVEYFSRTHKILTYDMRGFGKSSLPSGKYSHHDDLKAIFDEFGLEKAHLVGLSLGGEVAIDFALTYPGLVNRVTLLSTSLGGFKSTVNWSVKDKEEWLNHDVFASIKNKKPDVENMLSVMVGDYSGWHWRHENPREKIEPTAMSRLSEIEVPVMTVVGEYDLEYYHKISAIIKNGIKSSRQTIIPDAGHLVNLEAAGEINMILENS